MSANKKLEEKDHTSPLELVNKEIYLEDIKSRMFDLEDELSIKEARFSELTKKHQDLTQNLALAKDDALKEQSKDIEKYEQKVEQLKSEINALEETQQKVQLKKTEEIFQLKKSINTLREAQKLKNLEFESLSKEYQETKTLLDNSLNLLRDSREQSDNAQYEYEEKLKERMNEEKLFAQIQAKILSQLTQKELLEEQIDTASKEHDYSTEQIKNLNEDIHQLEIQISSLEKIKAEYNHYESKRHKSVEALENLKEELIEKKANITYSEQLIAELKDEKQSLRKKVEKAQGHLATNNGKLQSAEDELNTLIDHIENKKNELTSLEKEIFNLTKSQASVESQRDILQQEISDQNQNIEKAKKDLLSLESQTKKQTKTLSDIELKLVEKNQENIQLLASTSKNQKLQQQTEEQLKDIINQKESIETQLHIIKSQRDEIVAKTKKQITSKQLLLSNLNEEANLFTESQSKVKTQTLLELNQIQDSISQGKLDLKQVKIRLSQQSDQLKQIQREIIESEQKKSQFSICEKKINEYETFKINLEHSLSHLQEEIQLESLKKLEIEREKDAIILELANYKATNEQRINTDLDQLRKENEEQINNNKIKAHEEQIQKAQEYSDLHHAQVNKRKEELIKIEEVEVFNLQEKLAKLKSNYLLDKSSYMDEIKKSLAEHLQNDSHPQEFQNYINDLLVNIDVQEAEFSHYSEQFNSAPKIQRFWFKVLCFFFVLTFTLYAIIINPTPFKALYNDIHTSFVKSSDNEVYMNDFREKRQAKFYSPIKSTGFRESILDNVLHTSEYAQTIFNSEYQNQYILSLNEFVLSELNLHEDSVIKILEIETNLLKDLVLNSKKILISQKDKDIEQLSKRESIANDKLYRVLLTQDNLKRFNRFRGSFYLTYVNNMK